MPPASRIAPCPRAAIRAETALMAAYPGIYRHGMPTAGVIPAVAGRVEAISRGCRWRGEAQGFEVVRNNKLIFGQIMPLLTFFVQ